MAKKRSQSVAAKHDVERKELKQDPAVHLWVKLTLAGRSTNEIVDELSVMFPKASPRDTMQSAGEHFRQLAASDVKALHGFCLAATEMIFSEAIKEGDLATALRAVKQLKGLMSTDVPTA